MSLSISFDVTDDYSKFPFISPKLEKIGLSTPAEQYFFYGSVFVFLAASRKPFMKALWMDKYLNTTDASLKKMYAGRGNISTVELEAGAEYLQEMRRIPRRWAIIPVGFVIVQSARIALRSFSKSKDNFGRK